MRPAILYLTAFCTVSVTHLDAQILFKDNSIPDLYKTTPSYPDLSILVTSKVKVQSRGQYDMVAKPVFLEGGKTMLYDVSARFDQGHLSGIDKAIISYRQCDGYAIVVNTSNTEKPTQCVDLESGGHLIPPMNATAGELMKIKKGDFRGSNNYCLNEYCITAVGEEYNVCEVNPGPLTMITGNHLQINVSFVKDEKINSNGGKSLQLYAGGKPFVVEDNIGKKLLYPPTLS